MSSPTTEQNREDVCEDGNLVAVLLGREYEGTTNMLSGVELLKNDLQGWMLDRSRSVNRFFVGGDSKGEWGMNGMLGCCRRCLKYTNLDTNTEVLNIVCPVGSFARRVLGGKCLLWIFSRHSDRIQVAYIRNRNITSCALG